MGRDPPTGALTFHDAGTNFDVLRIEARGQRERVTMAAWIDDHACAEARGHTDGFARLSSAFRLTDLPKDEAYGRIPGPSPGCGEGRWRQVRGKS
jgi:hypothetical protein